MKHDSPTCKCDTFAKIYCPDCPFTAPDPSTSQLIQPPPPPSTPCTILPPRHSHTCPPLRCAYCPTRFPRRALLIAHYESGTCRTRLTSLLHPPGLATPAIATQRSWNARTSRYKCYLCKTDLLGFMHLHELNEHLASGVHDAVAYRCPYYDCARAFRTLSGMVQHVEMRVCGCMRVANWLAYYVVHEGGGEGGDEVHRMYVRGRAVWLLERWVWASGAGWRDVLGVWGVLGVLVVAAVVGCVVYA